MSLLRGTHSQAAAHTTSSENQVAKQAIGRRKLGSLEVSSVGMGVQLAELNASVAAIKIQGARLPEQVQVFSGVEAPPKK